MQNSKAYSWALDSFPIKQKINAINGNMIKQYEELGLLLLQTWFTCHLKL